MYKLQQGNYFPNKKLYLCGIINKMIIVTSNGFGENSKKGNFVTSLLLAISPSVASLGISVTCAL